MSFLDWLSRQSSIAYPQLTAAIEFDATVPHGTHARLHHYLAHFATNPVVRDQIKAAHRKYREQRDTPPVIIDDPVDAPRVSAHARVRQAERMFPNSGVFGDSLSSRRR